MKFQGLKQLTSRCVSVKVRSVEKKCICPLEGIIDVISKKWALLIISVVGNRGKIRFNEILRELPGISPKTLTKRLKELEAIGLIKREAHLEVPIRVEYSLTSEGLELRNLIRPLIEWAATKRGVRAEETPCLNSRDSLTG